MQENDTQDPTLATPAVDETPTQPAAEPTEPAETTPSLEESIRLAEQKAAEHHDAWLRAKAETENVRRRAQEDIAKASRYAIEKFAGELLAVRDSLEAALAVETPSVDSLKEGTELTLKQLAAAFEKSGLHQLDPVGQKFDPHRHQAISMLESEQEPNTVITVLQKGYLIGDRVLRPALVIVAKAKA
ncbi:nucleotide exchange factor GrpE [Rhodocyclus purpureus]|uniref:nucleotide exchange factor GrpE n=1 Tax=Rhodocyclus purpureus TaxID=1067 RepID=UPI0019127341|nr:nucleotide exchange factor GrpE [Rhodocyclus purpureus]MBK5913434.1 nucleotide exchange factor GrpE [Rhodocyclus purpureus]